jgi:hypothetical protein
VRPGWPIAIAAGVLVALLGGFLFGLRAGVALGPAAAALLLVGINARRLLAIATLALAAIPVIYLVDPASRLNNLSFDYATHHVGGHWAAVVAVWCIAAAALLDARVLRSAVRQSPPTEPRGTNSRTPDQSHSLAGGPLAERQRMD